MIIVVVVVALVVMIVVIIVVRPTFLDAIITGPAIQCVFSATTEQLVITVSTAQRVLATTAEHQVISCAAVENIRAFLPEQNIIPVAADDYVIPAIVMVVMLVIMALMRGAVSKVQGVRTPHWLDVKLTKDTRAIRAVDRSNDRIVAEQLIVACAASDGIVASYPIIVMI